MSTIIDEYDKKIIAELDINSRIPITQLARKIKLPPETVKYRLIRLVTKGYIKNFYTIINASEIGYRYYKVSLKCHGLTQQIEDQIVNFIEKEGTCSNLRITEGPYNIVFLSMHATAADLNSFFERFSKKFGNYVVEKNIHKIITSYKLNQKIILNGKKSKKCFFHAEPVSNKLSKLDAQILRILSTNARIKIIDLADMLEKDPRLIAYHIKKLEKNGIIVGYSVSFGFENFGLQFILLNINLTNHSLVPKIIDFFDETNTCIYAYELLGSHDLSLEMYVQNDDHLRKLLALFRQNFAEHYNSYYVSRIYEEHISNWSPFHV